MERERIPMTEDQVNKNTFGTTVFGWFSQKASSQGGHSLWKTADGRIVPVTMTHSGPCDYRWEDAIFHGELVECVKEHVDA